MEAQAIPMAKPKILRKLKVLFFQIFRNRRSSWLCSMVEVYVVKNASRVKPDIIVSNAMPDLLPIDI